MLCNVFPELSSLPTIAELTGRLLVNSLFDHSVNQSINQSMFYVMPVHIEVILDQKSIYYYIILTHSTMNNQFNNRIDNISIIQNISNVVLITEDISVFSEISLW